MNFNYYDDANLHWDAEENILSICSSNSLGSFSMSCSPLTAASDKIGSSAGLLARLPMPAIIGDDDSERSFLDDGECESQSTANPSSFDAAIDRVVTPFHPEIPIVRTRVLEELVERMPFPYPSASEPSAKRSGWGGYNFEQQKQQNKSSFQQNKKFWEKREEPTTYQHNKVVAEARPRSPIRATAYQQSSSRPTAYQQAETRPRSPIRATACQQSYQYLPTQLTARRSSNMACGTSNRDRFDPNEEEKMIFREDIGEFDTLLGDYHDGGGGRGKGKSKSNHREVYPEEFDFLVENERFMPRVGSGSSAVGGRRCGKRPAKRCKASSPSPPRKPAATRAPRDDEEMLYQKDIREFDVLLGRGPQIYQHEGNQRFHEVKMKIQESYLAAPKEQKVAISQSLVDAIHEIGGRFLKYDEAIDKWYEVTNRVAREKAAQALRETFTKEDRQKKRLKYKKAANSNITAGAV